MRWKRKVEQKYQALDTRICKGFLFFPKEIKGEYRWLEFAKWQERYVRLRLGSKWLPKKWLRLNE